MWCALKATAAKGPCKCGVQLCTELDPYVATLKSDQLLTLNSDQSTYAGAHISRTWTEHSLTTLPTKLKLQQTSMVHLEIAVILQESVGQAQLPEHCCMLYRQSFLWQFE